MNALPALSLQVGGGDQHVATSIQIVALLTLLSLAPAILITLTAFVRIVIVLSFLRQAVGTQNMPPNQVVVSLALFLTFFVMLPTIQQIQSDAAVNPATTPCAPLEKNGLYRVAVNNYMAAGGSGFVVLKRR